MWAANTTRFHWCDIICQKAQHIMKCYGKNLRKQRRMKSKFSFGWMDNFKRRRGLCIFWSPAKERGANEVAVQIALSKLLDKIESNAAIEVYSADECGLFYGTIPTQTDAAASLPERQALRDHFTVIPCASMDSSEKLMLFFLRPGARTRSFKKKSSSKLWLWYPANRKAWMTTDLFFNCPKKTHALNFLGLERHALLFVNNSNVHGI